MSSPPRGAPGTSRPAAFEGRAAGRARAAPTAGTAPDRAARAGRVQRDERQRRGHERARGGEHQADHEAAGQTAGHTASRSAAPTAEARRGGTRPGRAPGGRSEATGTSVPMATPGEAEPADQQRGSTRGSPAAVTTLASASRRCPPAPFNTVSAVAVPTRIATTHREHLAARRPPPWNPEPTQPVTSGPGEDADRAGGGHDGSQREPRALDEDQLQPVGAVAGVAVHHRGEEHVVQLVRQALDDLGQPLRDRPHRDRRRCRGSRRSRARQPSS